MKNVKKVFICLILTCIIICSFFCFNNGSDELKEIKTRGFLLVGTTGDYYPMTYFDDKTNSYDGFDIVLAQDLAKSLGVEVRFVPTSWTTLTEDTVNKKFDIAISGITITEARKKQALMSVGYLTNGKTILCRKTDVAKYPNLAGLNSPDVRVMVNKGGLNEKFARENLPQVHLIIHNVNYEIPHLIALGRADVMITEIIEANYYLHTNKNLAAPLINAPFTKGQIGMLLPKENKRLLKYADKFIKNEIKTGRIEELREKYIYCNDVK